MAGNYFTKHVTGSGTQNILVFASRNPEFDPQQTLEFQNLCLPYYKNFIFIYDMDHNWFLSHGVVEILRDIHVAYGTLDLVLGCSMGGWGLLRYRDHIPSKKYVAFCPQSFVDKAQWSLFPDHHADWANDLIRTDNHSAVEFKNDSNLQLLFGKHPGDIRHYKNLARLGYNVTMFDTTSHNVAAYCKSTEQLSTILFTDHIK